MALTWEPDCTCGHPYGEHRIDLLHKACGRQTGQYDAYGRGRLIICSCKDYEPSGETP